MEGLTSFGNISTTFPHISSCRLTASDQEVGHLNDLPHLRHLEVDKAPPRKVIRLFFLPQVEFSDDPDTGLFSLLTEHPNRVHFTHLYIEVEKYSESVFENENIML